MWIRQQLDKGRHLAEQIPYSAIANVHTLEDVRRLLDITEKIINSGVLHNQMKNKSNMTMKAAT